MGIIYKLTCKITNKVYIGQTVRTLEERWYSHTYEAFKIKLKTKISRAIRKYGPDNFIREIIENVSTQEELDEKEIYYIALFNSAKVGYNINLGGRGGKHGESTKKKISKANTKRVWTPEMRETMSVAILAWHGERGFVPKSEETKRKISEGNKGKKISAGAKAVFDKYNKEQSKPIICLNNGIEYPSITAVCKALNLNSGHMSYYFHGKCKHVKGYKFKLK